MKDLITLIDACCDALENPSFVPQQDGSTFCNLSVTSIAKAMGCSDLEGKTADQIMQFLTDSPDWSMVAFESAQAMANNGSLLIAGLSSSELSQGHGHVVVIRPGHTVFSGKWGQTPRCINVGAEMFIARAKRGPLIGQPAGLNEAFQPLPKIFCWRQTL